MNSPVFVTLVNLSQLGLWKTHEKEEAFFEETDATTETSSFISEDSDDSEVSEFFLECRELDECILFSSKDVIKKAVKRIMDGIMVIREESVMAGENGSSINLDTLINRMWPETMFEGFERHLFCEHQYNQVTTAQERLVDTLDVAEQERLVIVLSLKEGICEELESMGFNGLRKVQLQGCIGNSPSYEWQIRRPCSSGSNSTSWLHLKWPVAEAGEPPTVVDVDGFQVAETEDHPTGPPRGTQETGRGSRVYARDKGCGVSGQQSTKIGENTYFCA
mmetsp:Transcript_107357/g.213119  ORF Transcript_107357/g.213119 Transcript_107357/m.213119 type:complete len:277 (-) Transcript_107357:177-1007(-)|eukprot:CAMPEP_0172721112 /NCGR_PEP_ID=MMETSP1074-20121228/78363_1 /TAXON_ID=2916 /ORGANISM="Ceratium fusus, Strain PA161109" /LENGTH=276 /DNA_ID=CAMNT_0013546777 /DNA_START=55 /DNA_END=885 /DNA_ORIENTATION=+